MHTLFIVFVGSVAGHGNGLLNGDVSAVAQTLGRE